MKYFLTTTLLLILSAQSVYPQFELPDKDLKKIISPRYIQRTMDLLATSTPEKRNTVRILVYGQSLSAQDWWLEVKAHLEEQYQHANLIMDNKSIGGFVSQFLIKTVRRDILDFYPDLVIFHVLGSDYYYEEVLKLMRSQTTTEILIWNDPQNKPVPDDWHEKMSYKVIPKLALKYKCAFIDLRTPINELVKSENLVYADEFTRDGTHFNEKGCKLLASLIIPHLTYDNKFNPNPEGLLRTYKVGIDINWNNGELVLPFDGNRIDLVLSHNASTENIYDIYIDNKKPSEFQEAYNHTRPNDNGEKGWIWSVGAPVRIQRKAPWMNESFTLTFDSIDYDTRFFTFHVEGSESGFEGNGNNRTDFNSRSGKIFLDAHEVNDSISGDWHVFRTFDITKFRVEKGYTTTWETYLMGQDQFIPKSQLDKSIENTVILFQGIPNGKHELKLVTDRQEIEDIEYIKVYKPLL